MIAKFKKIKLDIKPMLNYLLSYLAKQSSKFRCDLKYFILLGSSNNVVVEIFENKT
jgi:hypothetical protein